ncbi:MAG: WG repeat-containing protein, partial [Bacteroidales bacterium]|nr:WG repeat-containing protein [Bacteroidales bacterium]
FYWSNSGDDTCFYIVSIGNKIGLIDCLGRVVFPIIYDEIKNLWNDIHVKTDIRVKKDNLYGLYHAEQQILPIKYDWIGLVLTRSSSKYDYCINASQNGCWGMYDSHGSLILPHDYDEINYEPTNTDEGFLVNLNSEKK